MKENALKGQRYWGAGVVDRGTHEMKKKWLRETREQDRETYIKLPYATALLICTS